MIKAAAIVDCSRSELYTRMMSQTSVIKRELDILRQAGIRQILVLTGEDHEEIELHLAHRGVRLLRQTADTTGIHRWQRALEILEMEGTPDRILIIPGCMPLISKDMIRRMIRSKDDVVMADGGADSMYPAMISHRVGEMILEMESGDLPDVIAAGDLSSSRLCAESSLHMLMITDEESYAQALEAERAEVEARRMNCQVKLMVSRGDRNLGPGVIHFLELIDETGSMSAACKSMEMSYSRGWTLIRNVEDQMGFLFLERRSGGKGSGSSRLTEQGREFVDSFKAMQEDLDRMSMALFALHFDGKFE